MPLRLLGQGRLGTRLERAWCPVQPAKIWAGVRMIKSCSNYLADLNMSARTGHTWPRGDCNQCLCCLFADRIFVTFNPEQPSVGRPCARAAAHLHLVTSACPWVWPCHERRALALPAYLLPGRPAAHLVLRPWAAARRRPGLAGWGLALLPSAKKTIIF